MKRSRAGALVLMFAFAMPAHAATLPPGEPPSIQSISPLSVKDVCLLSSVQRADPMRDRAGMHRWYLRVGQLLSSGYPAATVAVRLDTAAGHMTATVPSQSVVVVNAATRDVVLAASVTGVTMRDGTSVECVPRPVLTGVAAVNEPQGGPPRPVVIASALTADAPLNCAEPFAPGGYMSPDGKRDLLTLRSGEVLGMDSYTFMAGGGTALRLLSGNFGVPAVRTAAGAAQHASFAPAVLRCAALTRPFPLTVSL
jgi:hypothetical protein